MKLSALALSGPDRSCLHACARAGHQGPSSKHDRASRSSVLSVPCRNGTRSNTAAASPSRPAGARPTSRSSMRRRSAIRSAAWSSSSAHTA